MEPPEVQIVLYPIVKDEMLVGELWRAEHDGDHVFVNGQCPCGVLELGIIR